MPENDRTTLELNARIDDAPADPAWRDALVDALVEFCERAGAKVVALLTEADDGEEE